MLIDVTNTLHQPYTTGIQRVVRELAWQGCASGAALVEFSGTTGGWHRVDPAELGPQQSRTGSATATWARRGYRRLLREPRATGALTALVSGRPEWYEQARRVVSGRGRAVGPPVLLDGQLLVLPEVTSSFRHAQALRDLCATGQVRLGAFLHDVLPATHPEWFPVDPRHRFDAYLETVRHAERVAVASDYNVAETTALLPELRGRMGTFPMPAGLRGSSSAVRAIPPESPVFVMVGSLEPRKNHVRVIEAARRVADRTGPVTLVVVGGGGWDEGHVRRAIRQQRGSLLRVERRVGVGDDELAYWYGRATAVVYPSLAEGFGLPVIEALASGAPVITSATSALAEHARWGGVILVDPSDVEALADAMASLTDAGRWHRLAETIDREAVPRCWSAWAAGVVEWLAA